MWLRAFLMFLLVAFLLRAVRRLLQGVVQGATRTNDGGTRQPATVKMIADPVCGTYVVPGKALQLARGGETLYFCSDKCRDQWIATR
jgi:YHS domain-containing protein